MMAQQTRKPDRTKHRRPGGSPIGRAASLARRAGLFLLVERSPALRWLLYDAQNGHEVARYYPSSNLIYVGNQRPQRVTGWRVVIDLAADETKVAVAEKEGC